ncbi:MAG: leucine-rich repeat domain-containing protein [Bacteroidales bacterium]|nr:leucine-rich repeat domain-containing protein [Bacteroidales bacterium]
MKKLLLILMLITASLVSFTSCKEEVNDTDISPYYPVTFNDDYFYYETIPNTKNCIVKSIKKLNNGSIIIPSNVEYYGETYKVTKIGEYIASGQSDSISGNLIIPNTIIEIGKLAFSGCQKLRGSIVIPGSVKVIGDYAFNLCTSAKKIELNYGLEKIGDKAFYLSCTNYQNAFILTIPSSVLEIGNEAFNGVKINNVVSLNPIPPKITSNIFGDSFGHIYVPSNAVEVYKHDIGGWIRYSSRIYSL